MRGLLLAVCLLFGAAASGASAQERTSLTTSSALDLCEAWLAGTLRHRDVEMQGWQRLESRPENILLIPMASFSGDMSQVSFIRENFPGAEQRHCAFRWRFIDAGNHLADASAALTARGFTTQVERQNETEEVVTASRFTRGLVLAHVSMTIEACRPVVIGPNRGPCASEAIAEMGVYVVEARQTNQSE